MTQSINALDFLLLVVQLYALYLTTHYVVRYFRQMVGSKRVSSRFLKLIWESKIGLSLLLVVLIWVSINGIFGVDTVWLEYSAAVRKCLLIIIVFYIIHIELSTKDTWDYSRDR